MRRCGVMLIEANSFQRHRILAQSPQLVLEIDWTHSTDGWLDLLSQEAGHGAGGGYVLGAAVGDGTTAHRSHLMEQY
jgi:hypothetical protein